MVRVGILINASSKSPRLDPPFPHLPKTDIQNTIYKLTEKRQSCTGLFVHMILINNVFHSNCFFLFLIVVALLYRFPLKMFNIKDFINLV